MLLPAQQASGGTSPLQSEKQSPELDLRDDFTLCAAWKGQATRVQAASTLVLSKERTPEQNKLLGAIQIASKSLSALVNLPASKRPEDFEEQLVALRKERQKNERELNRVLGLDVIMATPNFETLIAAIPEGAAMVDYYVNDHLFAWTANTEGEIRLHYLGEAAEAEELSEAFLKNLITHRGGEGFSMEDSPDFNAKLYEKIWKPLKEDLNGREQILLCPDGFLGKLPFAVLQDEEGKYLLERHDFVYLEDPTAHVKWPKEVTISDGSFLAIGNVDYGKEPRALDSEAEQNYIAMSRNLNLRRAMDKTWIPLDATKNEMLVIAGMHVESSAKDARRGILSEQGASEARIKEELPNYNFLHIATHGFFNPPEMKNQLPGLSAGLVCANANQEQEEGQDDGFLTAEEVSYLNLQDCYMVVLSACETSLGSIQAGEGLQSLRRAFTIAGADSVISSMWQVGDESTAELMKMLYHNMWVENQGRSEALRNAQLNMLNHWRENGTDGLPSTWGAFVLAGEWR
jgi:CHAT domain-containing protein